MGQHRRESVSSLIRVRQSYQSASIVCCKYCYKVPRTSGSILQSVTRKKSLVVGFALQKKIKCITSVFNLSSSISRGFVFWMFTNLFPFYNIVKNTFFKLLRKFCSGKFWYWSIFSSFFILHSNTTFNQLLKIGKAKPPAAQQNKWFFHRQKRRFITNNSTSLFVQLVNSVPDCLQDVKLLVKHTVKQLNCFLANEIRTNMFS